MNKSTMAQIHGRWVHNFLWRTDELNLSQHAPGIKNFSGQSCSGLTCGDLVVCWSANKTKKVIYKVEQKDLGAIGTSASYRGKLRDLLYFGEVDDQIKKVIAEAEKSHLKFSLEEDSALYHGY